LSFPNQTFQKPEAQKGQPFKTKGYNRMRNHILQVCADPASILPLAPKPNNLPKPALLF
jgi:hypothetical protein